MPKKKKSDPSSYGFKLVENVWVCNYPDCGHIPAKQENSKFEKHFRIHQKDPKPIETSSVTSASSQRSLDSSQASISAKNAAIAAKKTNQEIAKLLIDSGYDHTMVALIKDVIIIFARNHLPEEQLSIVDNLTLTPDAMKQQMSEILTERGVDVQSYFNDKSMQFLVLM